MRGVSPGPREKNRDKLARIVGNLVQYHYLLVLRNLYHKRDARNNYTLPRTVLQKIQNILNDVIILRKKHLDRR